MAKEAQSIDVTLTDGQKVVQGGPVVQIVPSVPFVEPAPAPRQPPTKAQHDWLQKNPQYIPSARFFGRMVERGTLHSDGSYVPEAKHPVIDGMEGSIGVGIPLRR
jgi:hypothetical protein